MSDTKSSTAHRDLETDSQELTVPTPQDTEEERKAVRKMDYTLLPVMAMFYLLSFLDRSNIGNARVAGLQKDLHMTDRQYQICITVLYVPYIAAELPANLLLRKVGPRLVMPTLLTIWGVMVTLQGLVTSYGGLVTVRALLGLVEGPMFPGIVLYLSGFYTRRELSLRIALFFSSASLSGAFSGLLAAAIEKMHGVGGRPGWAWIFILEGLFTVIMGLLGFWLVPSTPRQSKFLTSEQKELIMARLERDRPSIQPSDKFSFYEVFQSLRSPHVIAVFVMFFMVGTNLYGLALFLPSIVNQLGFPAGKSQLLSVGPFGAGFFVTLFSAYWSDRYQSRGIATAMIAVLAVAGYALYLGAKEKFVAYGALYLMVPGIYATAPVMAAWMANNSEPYYRRATSVAFGFIATNSGGILSTWRFPTKEGPRFRKTTIMNLVFSIIILVGSVLNMLYLKRKNKAKAQPGYRERMLAKYTTDEKVTDGGVEAWMELGDRHPDFVYAL
ncbi:MFS general substrate transporter [Pholiota conissans]|uniref:MFS general substrate transporter n=1 Tax=Pholiota conissans TaxID=109636 RepID=A0A9P5Z396_9AGAR|nr:MFS general substrate transporter [Pholiota conissans]